jgi:hypothetical protein
MRKEFMKRVPSFAWWSAVGFATTITGMWAFWGSFEAFHEGWYFKTLAENLVCTAQYLELMMIFLVLSAVALRWRRVGAVLYEAFGIAFLVWIYMTRKVLTAGVVLGMMPMTLPPLFVGILFWLGRPKQLRRAYKISIILPLVVAAAFAVEPVVRISGRVDDGNRGIRVIAENGVKLAWAPQGPGWPNPDPHDRVWKGGWLGPSWEEAKQTCRFLAADGKTVAETPQNIWRLPTAEEAARSLARHGKNCGGLWDPASGRPSYTIKPDKESPLWNPYSPIIYWWTSSEPDSGHAYYIDFNGNVYPRNKNSNMGSQAFRAVRDLKP